MRNPSREQVLRLLDVRKFYTSRGLSLVDSGNEFSAKCPFHEDQSPSLTINKETGVYLCHAGSCGEKGSVFDFVMKSDNLNFTGAIKLIAEEVGAKVEEETARPEIPEDKVDQWHTRLLNAPDRLHFLSTKRGLNEETLKKYKIGHDGHRYTIPIRDEHGSIVNVRKYDPDAKGKDKMISHTETVGQQRVRYGEARLLPAASPDSSYVLLCEGEMDCLLAIQEGFPAMTATSGAGVWKPQWNEALRGKDVVIAYDNDIAGKRGAERVASYLHESSKTVRILKWPPSVLDKYDVTDWFVSLGYNAEGLQELIDAAVPYIPEKPADEPDSIEVSLADSGKAEFAGKPILMRVVCSGKDTTPYQIPGKLTADCDQDNGNACFGCGMSFRHHGKATIEFKSKDRETLGLIRCSDTQQKGFIARKLGVHCRCTRWGYKVDEVANIEEVQVIPELNGKMKQGPNAEYVTRTIYIKGHGIKTNASYNMSGYSFPHVTDQHATCLIDTFGEAETSIDSFKTSPEDIERMKIFQVSNGQSAWDKMFEISNEMVKVHGIRGRPEVQTALDLSWHSVLSFHCFGQLQFKGWVEVFIIGDSGQGKTSIALALCDHYKAGQRVQAEQSSSAGLIGGLTKSGTDHWWHSWGPVVLNDRRLLILDEWSGVREEDAERLTDVRSTGVAEIVKIMHVKAWARTRLIFLTNPKDGRSLRSYEYGVESIYPGLFKKGEDARRIDLAISVASGDVSVETLNQRNSEEECRYTSDNCANLVLWAWSRKPDQIVFERKAEDAMLDASMALARMYSSKIPLIEPADARWKLARLSAACAARLFSTEDGETLIVKPSHVEFAYRFINHCYEAPSMGYRSYSNEKTRGERYVRDNEGLIISAIRAYKYPSRLARVLLRERYLKIRELEYQIDATKEDVRKLIHGLIEMECLESTQYGFRKKPSFIELLRKHEEDDNFWDAILPEENAKQQSWYGDD